MRVPIGCADYMTLTGQDPRRIEHFVIPHLVTPAEDAGLGHLLVASERSHRENASSPSSRND